MTFSFSNSPRVRRWDGITRSTCDWDGLRRDPELWLTGDCLIHLYAKDQSRRGPSFRIPVEAIKSNYLITLQKKYGSQPSQEDEDSNTDSSLNLYIPGPKHPTRRETFNWHIDSRNFIAFCCNKAIVGESIGQALISLKRRLDTWSHAKADCTDDLTKYMTTMGYMDFSHSPDYALAGLQVADQFHLEDLWIDSFSHCVGMHSILFMSTEYSKFATHLKNHIEDATDRLETHLESVSENLGNFLEHELSPANLGLTPGARAHLDRFRTFLHGFYVRKFGYWPPPKSYAFAKSLLLSMYYDFQNLYEYLVDPDSTNSIQQQKLASGGVCVWQSIQAFDNRNAYEPLAHSSSRLPELAPTRRQSQSQRALKTLRLGVRVSNTAASNALARAANAIDPRVVNSPLVKAYREFESDASQHKEEKISVGDARKVRWIMVYCTFQMLVSVIKAPPQVRDSGPTYALCCDVSDYPPWKKEQHLSPIDLCDIYSQAPSSNYSRSIIEEVDEETDFPDRPYSPVTLEPDGYFNIAPDCEADNYNDHVQIKRTSSWRQTLSIRDPSTLARDPDNARLSRSYSVEAPTKPRLSTLLRNRSIQGSQPLSRRLSLVRSLTGTISSSNNLSSKPFETDAQGMLMVPHPISMYEIITSTNESDLDLSEDASTHESSEIQTPVSDASSPVFSDSANTSPTLYERPRSPVSESQEIDQIGAYDTAFDENRSPTQRFFRTPGFASFRPQTSVSQTLNLMKGRPKTSGKAEVSTPAKRSNSRRFTLGMFNAAKHKDVGEREGKRIRYSMLVGAS